MSRTIRVLCLLVILFASAIAQVPEKISWQGYLTDESGEPLVGPVGLRLRLFDAKTGGNQVYGKDTTGVVATNGVVNVPLGPFPGVDFGGPLYLQVDVIGGGALGPRSELTSVPYAHRAIALLGLRTQLVQVGNQGGMNVLAGAPNNVIATDVVGATIGGGGGYTFSDGHLEVPNSASGNWATIGGGRSNTASGDNATIAGGSQNSAAGNVSAIGGGSHNSTGSFLTFVGGGQSNVADGGYAVVGGGVGNAASGLYSAVIGGSNNTAGGYYSHAGGYRAHVRTDNETGDYDGDEGTFVWSDASSNDAFTSNGPNRFLIRAVGGVGIGTNNPSNQLSVAGSADFAGMVGIGTDSPTANLHVSGTGLARIQKTDNGNAILALYATTAREWRLISTGSSDPDGGGNFQIRDVLANTDRLTMTKDGRLGVNNAAPAHPVEVGSDGTNGNGAYLSAGGTWTSKSSRTVKQGFEAVDTRRILQTVADLPVLRWRYAGSAEGVHIGPMAEDFHAAFGTGVDERAIAMVDADGVALAAIQGLYEIVQELRTENEELRTESRELRAMIEGMNR